MASPQFTKTDFAGCVPAIICTLQIPVLRALESFINLIIDGLNAQIVALGASILALDILTAPVELALTLAQEAIDLIKAPIQQLLPVNLIQGCTDLGDISVIINDFANRVTASLEVLKQDAIRSLSFKKELTFLKTAIESIQLPRLCALQEVIQDCILLNQ